MRLRADARLIRVPAARVALLITVPIEAPVRLLVVRKLQRLALLRQETLRVVQVVPSLLIVAGRVLRLRAILLLLHVLARRKAIHAPITAEAAVRLLALRVVVIHRAVAAALGHRAAIREEALLARAAVAEVRVAADDNIL